MNELLLSSYLFEVGDGVESSRRWSSAYRVVVAVVRGAVRFGFGPQMMTITLVSATSSGGAARGSDGTRFLRRIFQHADSTSVWATATISGSYATPAGRRPRRAGGVSTGKQRVIPPLQPSTTWHRETGPGRTTVMLRLSGTRVGALQIALNIVKTVEDTLETGCIFLFRSFGCISICILTSPKACL